jgi:hypothetical protein
VVAHKREQIFLGLDTPGVARGYVSFSPLRLGKLKVVRTTGNLVIPNFVSVSVTGNNSSRDFFDDL